MSAQLDTTAELEEGGDSAPASTQSLSGSPPHESKMRQISQGVEDLTWQNMPKQSTPELDDQPQPEAEQDQDSSAVEGQHEPMDAENVSDNQQASDDGQQEAQGETVIPPSLRGENLPLIVDNDGADEHAGEADPAAAPPGRSTRGAVHAPSAFYVSYANFASTERAERECEHVASRL